MGALSLPYRLPDMHIVFTLLCTAHTLNQTDCPMTASYMRTLLNCPDAQSL